MERTITLRVVIEVPDAERDNPEWEPEIVEMMKGKLFHLFCVRNVVREWYYKDFETIERER